MRSINVLVLGALLSAAGSALAQPPAPPAPGGPGAGQPPAREGRPQPGGPGGEGRGQRDALSPEKAKAAWEAEAKTVAKGLSLSDEQTKAVVKAYEDARKGYDADMAKLREKLREEGGAGGGGEMREKIEEFNKSQRDKFAKALADAKLTSEQVTKANASLGLFNRQWDTITDAILGFKLEAAKQDDAMKASEEYVVAMAKARPAPGAEVDREAMRTAMQDARKKFTDKMKTLVSEEQMKRLEAAMGLGGGGRRPEGGGPGKGPGAPAGG